MGRTISLFIADVDYLIERGYEILEEDGGIVKGYVKKDMKEYEDLKKYPEVNEGRPEFITEGIRHFAEHDHFVLQDFSSHKWFGKELGNIMKNKSQCDELAAKFTENSLRSLKMELEGQKYVWARRGRILFGNELQEFANCLNKRRNELLDELSEDCVIEFIPKKRGEGKERLGNEEFINKLIEKLSDSSNNMAWALG